MNFCLSIIVNYFELLNEVVKKVRESDKVFGDVQLIVCGYFFKLPPVSEKYCFMTETWKKCQFKILDLKTCYRQKDKVFIEVLHKMRLGILLQKNKKIINSRFVHTAPLHIPRLYFTNRECNDYNKYRLKGINAALHEFKSVDYNIEGYNFQLVTLLKIKVGTVVMLRKNLTDELFNGRIGTTTKIQPEVIHVLFDDKETTKSITERAMK